MAEAHSTSPLPSVVHLACFVVGEATFALEVECVREVVGTGAITRLPNAPTLIEGVIDLRGSLIPVLDLARVLGLGEGPVNDRTRVAVLDFRDLVFGLRVDAATEVLSIDTSRLEDVPALATDVGYDVIRSMVRREGQSPVMLLSLDNLIASIECSALSGATPGRDAS